MFLPFHTVHGVLKARILKWFAIPFSSGPHFVRTVRKLRRKKEPPLRTVDEGLYWAVALGQNSRGRVSEETKGVCEV